MTPAISLKLNSLKSISFNLYGCNSVLVAKQHIRDIPNPIFGDPITNNVPWDITISLQTIPCEKSTPLCASTKADIPDCQRSAAERLIAQTGLSAWESRGACSQLVGIFPYYGHTRTHTHSAPVMLGRFQPAASERSALEFLRPKEISNWVMDMVTWTMKRQRGRKREVEKLRERRRKKEREARKHNMTSLSISPPHDWPWLQCPKTNLSGN